MSEKGFTVTGPLLPGHGTTIEDLDRGSWHDWHNFVEVEWNRLKKDHRKVFVWGLSRGEALALHLAAHNKVDGVVTLASGTKLADWRLPLFPILKHFIKKVKKTKNSYARGPNRLRFAYEYNPIRATQELLNFYSHLSETLSDINDPLLVVHAKNDIILRLENTDIIIADVSYTDTKVVLLEKAKHNITLNAENDTIATEVLDFIRNH